ncbi:hypothetical protein AJ79_07677 [Helicocarpus griseus UAMH5409]|uniref:Uncharacterized protein n=1 Tax=Helicocarpus griseus UAMH5409 TaxID=1447875 RepID=A0A2B7X0J4_9EURO|nr:hypothetical protein AJ79_07677 [Helicocarpus griseus UAMH5409]
MRSGNDGVKNEFSTGVQNSNIPAPFPNAGNSLHPFASQPLPPSAGTNGLAAPNHYPTMMSYNNTPALQAMHYSNRTSAPPFPPPPTVGFSHWTGGPVTSSPAIQFGQPSFPNRPVLSGGMAGFGSQFPMPAQSATSVASLQNHGGMGTRMVPPASQTVPREPQVKQEVESALKFSDDTSKQKDSVDDVMSAAAAAAIKREHDSRFGDVDLQSIDPHLVIFCFGVLGIVAHLMPTFSYVRTAAGNWVAYLTYWGTTVFKDGEFEDKFIAKAESCRAALEGLKDKYASWTLPELPGPDVPLGSWIWTALLQEYCDQHNLGRPVYTKYSHDDGFRYAVDVGNTSYFGANKSYKVATEAIHACAHVALYSLLISGPEVLLTLVQTTTTAVRKRNAARNRALAGDPGILTKGIPRGTNTTKPVLLAPAPPKTTRRGKKKNKGSGVNANLLLIPTETIRIKPTVAQSSDSNDKKISSRDLDLKTKQYTNPCERVEKPPEYQVDSLPGQEQNTLFSAAASFPNNPFLVRVGHIGRTKYIAGLEQSAKEKCAEQVAAYLINMVKEDEEWGDPSEKQEANIRQWENRAATAAATTDLLGLGLGLGKGEGEGGREAAGTDVDDGTGTGEMAGAGGPGVDSNAGQRNVSLPDATFLGDKPVEVKNEYDENIMRGDNARGRVF